MHEAVKPEPRGEPEGSLVTELGEVRAATPRGTLL